jgi:Tripartite ATP-independent periplasmic transporter, DctM component
MSLGLDQSASHMLSGVLGFTQGTPFLFIVVVALVGIVVQLFISKGQAVLLLSLVLLPVAASFGLNPWIAAIVILATSSMWYYRAQTSSYALAFSLSEGRLFTDNQGRIACLIFTAAMFAGLAVSMPYWHALGLL